MTQAYLNGSTGRKSHREGRKSNTEGPHGGPQDEGPCRYQLDDDGEEQRLYSKAELRQIRLCVTGQSPTAPTAAEIAAAIHYVGVLVSDLLRERAEREREAKRSAYEDRKAELSINACKKEGKDSTFGTRPAGKITLEGDGLSYGRNRALSKTTQDATQGLYVKVNAIEATVANDDFKSFTAAVATAAAEFDAAADATEALSLSKLARPLQRLSSRLFWLRLYNNKQGTPISRLRIGLLRRHRRSSSSRSMS
jgi:hypothetical protein